MKHLHRRGLNGICSMNERCWEKTKEKFFEEIKL